MNIFCSQQDMPHVEGGDIVIVYSVKAQSYNSIIPSLLTNFRTDIHVYDGYRLSKCRSARQALHTRRVPTRKTIREPTAKEDEYVLSLYEKLDKISIPDKEETAARAAQSLNASDKFSELKDVKEGKFADLIVEVAKQPFDLVDRMSLWVSDYTENSRFYDKSGDSVDLFDYRDGDPFNYTAKFNKKHDPPLDDRRGWVGPSGKKSLQITCWEPHADFVRNNVNAGDWVRLRNVQIGTGRDFGQIEGFLRGDRMYPDRIYVETLDLEADPETIDPHLKDAVRRKRDYEREHKRTSKGQGPGKRGATVEAAKENSKSRRKRLRTEKQKDQKEKESKAEEDLGLNNLIVCENEDKKIVPLSTVLEPVIYHSTINGEQVALELPFNNAKYRTQVRVVDFHPANLQDFSVGEKKKKYACLSDDGNGTDDDGYSSSDEEVVTGDQVGRVWKWRFALKLEEVSNSTSQSKTNKKRPATTWAVVDNPDAQLLIGLDAANLHSPDKKDLLEDLREKMFILWGNLEECKSRDEAAARKMRRSSKSLAPVAPPVDSDKEDNDPAADTTAPTSSQLTNKPFRCCIEQYGIKVEAETDEEADAGDGYQWKRMFKLFGTQIKGD